MDVIEALQAQIVTLSSEELAVFRRWYLRFDVGGYYRWFRHYPESGDIEAIAAVSLANTTTAHPANSELDRDTELRPIRVHAGRGIARH